MLHPKDVSGYLEKCYLFLILLVEKLKEQGKIEEAVNCLEQALEHNQHDSNLHFMLGK